MRESDAFDDDADHWGLVVPDTPDERQLERWWRAYPWVGMLLFLLGCAVFMVWSGVFYYG